MRTNLLYTPTRDYEQLAGNIRRRLDRPLVLVGMMGAGKSRLGRMLAKSLGLPFFDTDAEIEQSAGCSIPEIFERMGEANFRAAEVRVFQRLLDQNGIAVIASGGGAVMTPAVADLVFADTLSVWVRADLELMMARNRRWENRPLLANRDIRQAISELMDKRYPVYARAHVVVDSRAGPATDTLHQALFALSEHLDTCAVPR